jgi:hypothetical protein
LEANINGILFEDAIQERVQSSGDLLGEGIVGREDGFPVEEDAFVLLIAVDWGVVGTRRAHFFFFLLVDSG